MIVKGIAAVLVLLALTACASKPTAPPADRGTQSPGNSD